jgi:hypothetical protein
LPSRTRPCWSSRMSFVSWLDLMLDGANRVSDGLTSSAKVAPEVALAVTAGGSAASPPPASDSAEAPIHSARLCPVRPQYCVFCVLSSERRKRERLGQRLRGYCCCCRRCCCCCC